MKVLLAHEKQNADFRGVKFEGGNAGAIREGWEVGGTVTRSSGNTYMGMTDGSL